MENKKDMEFDFLVGQCCGYMSLLLRKFFCQNLIFAWRIWELNKERKIYQTKTDGINNKKNW